MAGPLTEATGASSSQKPASGSRLACASPAMDMDVSG